MQMETSTMTPPPRAVLADDERLMREQLRMRLKEVWPGLQVVAEARNGIELVELVRNVRPEIVFLDIQMPGLTGIEAAREILQMETADDEWLPEIVFITAYDEYAVQAFEQGAVDYVLKPAEMTRLEITAQRLQRKLRSRETAVDESEVGYSGAAAMQSVLAELANTSTRLEFVQAAIGNTVRLIPVRDVLFFISDEKYTRVQTAETEALIRKPIKELVYELDPKQFWQIHRSTIVNVQAVSSVTRDDRGRQIVSVRGHAQMLEVSRSFAGLFKGM